MEPQQVIEFIRKQLLAGQTRPQIEHILGLNQVSRGEMEIAFHAALWEKNFHVPFRARHPRWRLNVLAVIFTLLVTASAVLIYLVLVSPDQVNQYFAPLLTYLPFNF